MSLSDQRRTEEVEVVVATGCGLDLPGNGRVAVHGWRSILSGEAREAWCHERGREGGSDVQKCVWVGGGLGPDWDQSRAVGCCSG